MKRERTIHLGFEMGSGNAVEVPIAHMAVMGQTQMSGKTTTLEALISRADVRAVAFITKRGEGSFRDGRFIAPYFKERADWEFVHAVLEATMRQRLYKHRAFIIEVCRNTQTLAQVQKNVKQKLADPKVRGFAQGMYIELDAYLEKVVPQIARLPYSDRVQLAQGLNIVDLSSYVDVPELQMLVIRSVMEWVYEKEEGVITVVPEAWEFIPEGRNSPVKLAAESLVRKGAALHNFLWLDSQDMAGVAKVALRAATVWLIGVQREPNELQRALKAIPDSFRKPKASEVATLKRGQFFACFGNELFKTYVQPAWMGKPEARAVATGETMARPDERPKPIPTIERESKPEPMLAAPSAAVALEDEDEMSQKDVERLSGDIQKLTAAVSKLVAQPSRISPQPVHAGNGSSGTVDAESLYQQFKARLIEDAPVLIKAVIQEPELAVQVERVVLELGGNSLGAKISQLIADGFFNEPIENPAIHKELKRRGVSYDNRTFGLVMQKLSAGGALTIEENGYKKSPKLKITRQ